MRARHLLVLVAVAAACDSGSSTSTVKHDAAAGTSGSGGTSATGGNASGGASGTGGAGAAGGAGGNLKGTGGGGGSGGTIVGGTTGRGGASGTGGAPGTGGRTSTPRDGGSDVLDRLDGASGTGGTGPGAGGNGGARLDGGPDARPDVAVDIARDAGPDTGFFKPTPVSDGGTCPFKGNVTYTLQPSSDSAADQQIKKAMDQAMFYYNCYSNLSRALTVNYDSSVASADGNINGHINFGPSAYRTLRVAMHEIGHTFGMGTASNWRSFIGTSSGSGPWTGKNGIAQRDALLPDHWQDTQKVLTADDHIFWPYGLSYDSDYKTEDDLIGHCMLVMAIRMDLGLK